MDRWTEKQDEPSLRGVLAAACSAAGVAWANADDQAARRQRLDLLFISHDGVDEPTAHASGPIRGHGTETQEKGERTPDGVKGTLTLRLAGGTVSAHFVEGDIQQEFDPQACAATASARGTMEISGGTGTCAGAKGTLKYTRRGRIVGARGEAGECLGAGSGAKPKVAVMQVSAEGTASLSD